MSHSLLCVGFCDVISASDLHIYRLREGGVNFAAFVLGLLFAGNN